MTFESQWIENDFNPFILFNSKGRVVSLNSEAQYLLGYAETSTIFEITTTYASTTFGFKTTFLSLEFGRFKFFGITVGYENDDEIGIKLYQMPTFKFAKNRPVGEIVNVYTLIDLCISSNSINSNTKFFKEFDPTIPEIRLNVNLFIKLLNKVYESLSENSEITTIISFKVGEYIKFDGVKHSLFTVEVKGELFKNSYEHVILELCEKNGFSSNIKSGAILINIPMITEQ